MEFEITCNNCGEKLRVDTKYVGRHGRCPRCRTKFTIREPAEPPSSRPTKKGQPSSRPIELGEGVDEASFALVFPWYIELWERLKMTPCWAISAVVHVLIISLIAGVTWQTVQEEQPDKEAGVVLKKQENDKVEYLQKEDVDRFDDLLQKLSGKPEGLGTDLQTEAPAKEEKALGIIGIGGIKDTGTSKRFVPGGGRNIKFIGVDGGAKASTVVFVVDCSGSMEGARWREVLAELRRSIEALNLRHKFSIIFFSDLGRERQMPPANTLVVASTENKEAAERFIASVSPSGGTEPSGAMERALMMKPDVIYLLTDGEFHPMVRDQIAGFNKDKRTAIFTLAFKSKAGEKLLRKIAMENRGKYKFVP